MSHAAWRLPDGLEVGAPIAEGIDIPAGTGDLWALIAAPGNLKRFHPFCAATEVIEWDGAGSVDTITYYSGFTYRRRFAAWFDGVGYDLELGVAPEFTARVVWRLAEQGAGRCRLDIAVYPYLKASLPEAKKLAYQRRLFGETLQHYLRCVVQGVRYKVVTGEDVTEDQFGRNPHYSRALPCPEPGTTAASEVSRSA